MTGAEHLAWARQRAREFIAGGNLASVYGSLVSDLNKHDDTRALVHTDTLKQGMAILLAQGLDEVVRLRSLDEWLCRFRVPMTPNWETFIASKRWVDDLVLAIDNAFNTVACGYSYLGSLYIESTSNWPDKDAAPWYLLIGNRESFAHDICQLEERLFQFAESEGFFSPPPAAA